jgi:hypothetical protein
VADDGRISTGTMSTAAVDAAVAVVVVVTVDDLGPQTASTDADPAIEDAGRALEFEDRGEVLLLYVPVL